MSIASNICYGLEMDMEEGIYEIKVGGKGIW